jgi:hypothetical protein
MLAKLPIIEKFIVYTLYIKFRNKLVSINSVESKIIIEEKSLVLGRTNNKGQKCIDKAGNDAEAIVKRIILKLK